MLKEIAVADAYGAGFEFSSREKVSRCNNLSGYLPHDLYGFSAKYTDDTQMSIAVAEVLSRNGRYCRESIASKFVECFKRDKRKGYSKGFYNLLTEVNSGRDLIEKIRPDSDRNGAAMRSVPVGLLEEKTLVIRVAKEQAAITHNTEIAINSSCAVALAAYFGLHENGRICDLLSFLESEGFADWDFNWSGEVSVGAYDTVSAAFSSLLRNDNLADLLVGSVAYCGDTDSVASISVGLASCFGEYSKNLPRKLIQGLDEPIYGIEYLENLDRKLYKRYNL